ncbi:fimb protein [Comamonas koreensis]|uniref:fimb protein n=1 Tax=Comamonas koreensis TaxID=160825 RepID=UPI0015FC1C1C|nr:fimb protein [Comamonas koreensis]
MLWQSDCVISFSERIRFAMRYALRHLGISVVVGFVFAFFVFWLIYPAPYRSMLGVDSIFFIILLVDVACGPLLTLILVSPAKTPRERWLDFGLVGLIQIAALCYGMSSLWMARPVALIFEVDRLVVVTANEIDTAELAVAPAKMNKLPLWGVMKGGTRSPKDSDELFASLNNEIAGISPAMRPSWWVAWDQQMTEILARAKPLSELISRRPEQVELLLNVVKTSGLAVNQLFYLPLTSSKQKDWVVLFDISLRFVGYAPVDGFN